MIRSGAEQASSIAIPALVARYSGSDRPAWRMYHTGMLATGWRRQALMNGESAVGVFTPGIVSQPLPGRVRPLASGPRNGSETPS